MASSLYNITPLGGARDLASAASGDQTDNRTTQMKTPQPTFPNNNNDPTIFESERLQDPLNDRVVKSVPRPPTVALSIDRVFPQLNSNKKPFSGSEDRHEVPNLALIKDYLM